MPCREKTKSPQNFLLDYPYKPQSWDGNLVLMISFLDYRKDSKHRLFGTGERVRMSRNSWPMPRRFGPLSKPISGKETTDRLRILRRLSNVTRREPGPGQQARVSQIRGSESQTKNTPRERTTTFAYDVGNPVTMHQPAQRTLQLRKPDRDNQERLHRRSLPLYSTPYGRTLLSISGNETGFNQSRPRLVTNTPTTLIVVIKLTMRSRSQKTREESGAYLSAGL
jgi:hypothetical protein